MSLIDNEKEANTTLDELLLSQHETVMAEPKVDEIPQHINVLKRQQALEHLNGLRDQYITHLHQDIDSDLIRETGSRYGDFRMRMIRKELEYLPRDTQQQRDEADQVSFALSYNEDIRFTQRTTELTSQKPNLITAFIETNAQPRNLVHKLGVVAVRAQNAVASRIASRLQTSDNENSQQRKGYGKVATWGAVIAVGGAVAYYSLSKVGMDGFLGIGGNGSGANPNSGQRSGQGGNNWFDQIRQDYLDQPNNPSDRTPADAPGAKGLSNGFQAKVVVEHGNGYTQELQELFERRDMELNARDSYKIYNHLTTAFPGKQGEFFNDHSIYDLRSGDYGISSPGIAHWNQAVLDEIQRFAEEQKLLKKKFS